MEQVGYETPPDLDAVFLALADPTRRAILVELTKGEASVGDLAKPFAMSQPAISKHLRVLERAQLISRRADRQRRLARLEAAPLRQAVSWLTAFHDFWEGSLDQLDALLTELQSNKDDSV